MEKICECCHKLPNTKGKVGEKKKKEKSELGDTCNELRLQELNDRRMRWKSEM